MGGGDAVKGSPGPVNYLQGVMMVAALSCALPRERGGVEGPFGPAPEGAVRSHCRELRQAFRRRGWERPECEGRRWTIYRVRSVLGRPLLVRVFGPGRRGGGTTLIMCGVHGDEITPAKFCQDVLDHLERSPPTGRAVVVAPLVSPDGLFRKRPTRFNANGVDLNRNFPTADFHASAIRMWKTRYAGDPRRYPGERPMSEPETAFQVDMVRHFRPDRIISVHAPLTLLDYDGPGELPEGAPVADRLLTRMSERAGGYRIKNYPFFPGSLGNWAGNERGIPTYTLELPSSDARRHRRYWALFKGAIRSAVSQELGTGDPSPGP